MKALVALAIGLAAFACAALWGWIGGISLMPSYLAAWLAWAGLPFGSLVLLLCLEAAGGGRARLWAMAFRTLALGMPLAALLFVPVLFRLPALYPWLGGTYPGAPFGRTWLQSGFFTGRAIAYLAIMTLLALFFSNDRPLGTRRAAAAFALFITVLVGTLAAIDWIMSLDPSLHSGEFGLLIIGQMAATAATVAVLIGWVLGRPATRGAAILLATVGAVWMYLHFMHFLVMWSGDEPAEVAWYLARDAAAGRTVEWLGFLAGFVLPLALLVTPVGLQDAGLPLVALAALVAHVAEALWFVTPVFRRHFGLTLPDVLMLVGIGGLVLGFALLVPPRRVPQEGLV